MKNLRNKLLEEFDKTSLDTAGKLFGIKDINKTSEIPDNLITQLTISLNILITSNT